MERTVTATLQEGSRLTRPIFRQYVGLHQKDKIGCELGCVAVEAVQKLDVVASLSAVDTLDGILQVRIPLLSSGPCPQLAEFAMFPCCRVSLARKCRHARPRQGCDHLVRR